MKNKLRFAIYGCGVIAKIHAAAISELDGADLYACADVVYDAAASFAEKHGIVALDNFDSVLESENVDVVCICTPSGTHAKLAIKALEKNKHVVLEKPMAISSEECNGIISALERSQAKITVISQMRTSPDVLRAAELVNSGKLGKIILAELNMRYYRGVEYYKGSWRGTKKMDGGGALMNQGIHGIDLIRYIMGPIKNVQSIVRTLEHNIEVEDTAVAALEYENGALGVIVASTATHPGFDREIKINGTRGAIELKEDRLVRMIIDGTEYPCEKFTSIGGAGNNTLLDHKAHARQIGDFIRAIRGENIRYVNESDGRCAVDIIEQIYKKSV